MRFSGMKVVIEQGSPTLYMKEFSFFQFYAMSSYNELKWFNGQWNIKKHGKWETLYFDYGDD